MKTSFSSSLHRSLVFRLLPTQSGTFREQRTTKRCQPPTSRMGKRDLDLWRKNNTILWLIVWPRHDIRPVTSLLSVPLCDGFLKPFHAAPEWMHECCSFTNVRKSEAISVGFARSDCSGVKTYLDGRIRDWRQACWNSKQTSIWWWWWWWCALSGRLNVNQAPGCVCDQRGRSSQPAAIYCNMSASLPKLCLPKFNYRKSNKMLLFPGSDCIRHSSVFLSCLCYKLNL